MVFVMSSYFQYVFCPHGHTKPAFSNSSGFEKRLRTALFAEDISLDYKICTLLKMGTKKRNLCFETSEQLRFRWTSSRISVDGMLRLTCRTEAVFLHFSGIVRITTATS